MVIYMYHTSPPSPTLVNAFLREIQQGRLPDVTQIQRHSNPAPLPLDAFLTCSNRHGDTPFLVAAREGHVTLLEVLHRQYGMPLEHQNVDGKTAMHEAAQSGQGRCIAFLVSQGAKVDALKRADWWVCQSAWPPFMSPIDTTGHH